MTAQNRTFRDHLTRLAKEIRNAKGNETYVNRPTYNCAPVKSSFEYLRAGTGVRALRECCEVKPSLVSASIQGWREGHEGRLHVVQGALDEAVVILNK